MAVNFMWNFIEDTLLWWGKRQTLAAHPSGLECPSHFTASLKLNSSFTKHFLLYCSKNEIIETQKPIFLRDFTTPSFQVNRNDTVLMFYMHIVVFLFFDEIYRIAENVIEKLFKFSQLQRHLN